MAFWVLIQVPLKSITLAHTAFPAENSSSAPAPALTPAHLWSEPTASAGVLWQEEQTCSYLAKMVEAALLQQCRHSFSSVKVDI